MTLIFEQALLSVVMDAAEQRLFAGADKGHIHQVNLFSKPVRVERHISEDDSSSFIGHHKPVTCLCVTIDGATLISGSQDCSVKLWDIQSRQCVRTIQHKGA